MSWTLVEGVQGLHQTRMTGILKCTKSKPEAEHSEQLEHRSESLEGRLFLCVEIKDYDVGLCCRQAWFEVGSLSEVGFGMLEFYQ